MVHRGRSDVRIRGQLRGQPRGQFVLQRKKLTELAVDQGRAQDPARVGLCHERCDTESGADPLMSALGDPRRAASFGEQDRLDSDPMAQCRR